MIHAPQTGYITVIHAPQMVVKVEAAPTPAPAAAPVAAPVAVAAPTATAAVAVALTAEETMVAEVEHELDSPQPLLTKVVSFEPEVRRPEHP